MHEIDLTDADVIGDPFAAYGRVREQTPLARLQAIPGTDPWWVVTRHEQARAMLSDPRFEIRSDSFMRPDVPDDCLPYMRTMSEMNGQEHARMRKLVAPAFTPRRAADFRPRIESIVEELLDAVESQVSDGTVDLLPHFTRPLPMDVICEWVGIPEDDRMRWRAYGATVATGAGPDFAKAIPGIMDGAKAAIARRRDEPGDDLLTDLIAAQADDGDRLTDTEMVTLVWHLVMAGQTPTNLIANAVHALLAHPRQLEALRDDLDLMPGAVEELIRWCGPTLLTIPRYAREDAELCGTRITEGQAVVASVAAANRDPRVFTDPETLDITRPRAETPHLGFAHGPHFCLGASIARVQTQVAITTLLQRYPGLTLASAPDELRAPDPGTWRLTALPVTLTS
ncbi:cytochrome P450 [Actinomadura sp. 7K507]|uniref:cytochrome P450 family protein n=1 Tax=Actinomadura sp. 7K507 TaxID=2530365 RepID=UPI00104DC168|nr:cytochrome P450 [Actinomadura sp. 7K507]TDC83029.1 cytochrome P450 [Actinomadura sp. 7K507]